MYFVYVLLSLKDRNFYTGYTSDIDKRILEHNEGLVKSTSYRRPLKLVYYEVSYDKSDAMHREIYLKSTYGKRYIKNRLKHFLAD